MSALLPLYHPTTCLAVDDDRLYLDSFCYNYADVTLCATEYRPEHAIERLLKDAARTGLAIDDANLPPAGDERADDPVVRLPASRIAAMASDPARFARVSVAIVDFVMPGMTGVELCRRIKHLPVRKILMTGKTGDATAVAAFNEGLIDLFLVKHDPELPGKLPRIIREQQHAYFEALTAPLSPIAKLEDTAFLGEPAIAAWVRRFSAQIKAIEHSLLLFPPGLTLSDEEGRATNVWIYGPDRMRAQLEIADEGGAPRALVERLRAGDAILACPTQTGFYEQQHALDWQNYVWPCEEIEGNSVWKVAIQRGPSLGRPAASLRQYRRSQAEPDRPT